MISFSLRLEHFLGIFEALTELNELREDLCCGVKPLNGEFLSPIIWERVLYQIEYLILW